MASDGDPDAVTPQQLDGALAASGARLPAFNCPSRRPAINIPTPCFAGTGESMRNATTPTEANRCDYKMNGGSAQVYWNAGPSLADGIAGNGFISMAGTNGLTALRSEVRAAHVRDGMSHTYLVGEKYLNPVDYTNGLSWSDDQSMLVGDYLDLVGWTNVPPAQDLRGQTDYVRFGSAHATGFNMAMADGSTHEIGYDVDATVHMNRGGRSGP